MVGSSEAVRELMRDVMSVFNEGAVEERRESQICVSDAERREGSIMVGGWA